MRKVVIILGPTATGKTVLGIELACMFSGEIVNADSMQVYRYMDIGTAKPSLEDRKKVAHHLIDIKDPDEEYTASAYRKDALKRIREIHSRGRNVFVVGGTGLYIKALTQGIFEGPGGDRALRESLLEEAERKGRDYLHALLKEVDPVSASRIHPNNTVRIVRALEVYYLTGRPISEFQREHAFSDRPFDTLRIGLTKDRKGLYRDIEQRVDRMMEEGLVEETRRLLEMGYSRDLKPLKGLGYKEMVGYIDGMYPLDEAIRLLKRNTKRYAKRQIVWFKKDREIIWFHPEQYREIISTVRAYLSSGD